MIDIKRSFVSGSTIRTAGALTAAGFLLAACYYYGPAPGHRGVIGPGYHGRHHGHYGDHGYYYRDDDARRYRR